MPVKAKFKCESITDKDFGNGYSTRIVAFRAVWGPSGENATFSKATPSGSLEMQIDKETAAYNYFVPGKSYYLNIEEAPE